jgi:3-hydroxyacyl-CoA dehydrogenase
MISTERHGEILVVVIDNPPVNALGAAIRLDLRDALAEAVRDDAVKAVVIRGAGRLFSGGADITEFSKPPSGPFLPTLLDEVEACAKPVVAAIHGTAFGGGLELALACHYRIAAPSAKLGLPEVKLGLLPGAGGTQRLPRLVGVGEALAMIVSGNPVGAAKAAESGLVDRLVAEDRLTGDAVDFARNVAVPGGPRRTGERAARTEPGIFERFAAEQADRLKGLEAPAACMEAVRGAVERPLADGLAHERELFLKLLRGSQSQALRHIFFAERAAARIDGIPANTALLPVNKVGIVGAGTMGGGIAMNFLSAGIPVTLVEREPAPLDRGVGMIHANYERTARRGRLTGAQVEQAMGLLTPSLSYDDLADCDLVIEAVFETMEVKKQVFSRLDRIVKPGAILASNTSYLDIDEIAAVTGRPDFVLGLHFFSPANVMRLLEIVRGAQTSAPVLATAMALARRIGKIAVVAGVCHGFIGNRMLEPRQKQANKLILEGAKPWDVDRVLVEFGMPMGPFQMADLAGLDLGWDEKTSSGSTIREILCERGRRGQKTGRGFYDYDENRKRTPSAEVEQIVTQFAASRGIPQRSIGDDEIRERLLYVMVNEAAKILEEGIAQRASDIDVVWVYGYGWPATTGGPVFWAERVGLEKILAGLEKHRDRLGDDGIPSHLLVERAAAGKGFEAGGR